jgi:hypothetical protein
MLFPAARKKLKEEFLKNSKVSDEVRVDQVSKCLRQWVSPLGWVWLRN